MPSGKKQSVSRKSYDKLKRKYESMKKKRSSGRKHRKHSGGYKLRKDKTTGKESCPSGSFQAGSECLSKHKYLDDMRRHQLYTAGFTPKRLEDYEKAQKATRFEQSQWDDFGKLRGSMNCLRKSVPLFLEANRFNWTDKDVVAPKCVAQYQDEWRRGFV